jgi:hypothetical protein
MPLLSTAAYSLEQRQQIGSGEPLPLPILLALNCRRSDVYR